MGKLGNPLRRPWSVCYQCGSKNVRVDRVQLDHARSWCNACGAHWDGYTWRDSSGKDIGRPTFGRYGNFT